MLLYIIHDYYRSLGHNPCIILEKYNSELRGELDIKLFFQGPSTGVLQQEFKFWDIIIFSFLWELVLYSVMNVKQTVFEICRRQSLIITSLS